jgi:hypothetical protein
MKRWKKILLIICGLPVLVALLALFLTPLVRMRQASMKPLNPATLAEFGVKALDKADPPLASSIPAGASGTDTSKDTNTTESLSSGAKPKTSPRLAYPPSAAAARQALPPVLSGWRHTTMRVSLGALKRVEAVVWFVKPDSTGEFAIQIGNRALAVGDAATARDYFREALRTGKRRFSGQLILSFRKHPEKETPREDLCGLLAWYEEDPEAATALLQESCASGDPSLLAAAMRLAILTDSDDLADCYFGRWSDTVGAKEAADWLKWNPNPAVHPQYSAWIKRHRPKPGD